MTFKKGFTIIELIVVITIFSILVSITLFNFAGFNESISLSNLAQQIAGFVKKAQTAGSLGKLPPPNINILSPNWLPTYGIYFSQPDQFVYFVDNDVAIGNDRHHQSGVGAEEIEKILIQKGKVSDLCINQVCGQSDLHITFQRPNLSAFIVSGFTMQPAEKAEIIIESPSGKLKKKIVVHQVGQISIENVTP